MGSCCVREKEEHPTTQNMPHHIQVIRMQRRELLINHQQSKSIHQLQQAAQANHPHETTDFDTNNSTNFSPNSNKKDTPSEQPPLTEQEPSAQPQNDIENETEEINFDGNDGNEVKRVEQDKCSTQNNPLFMNLQTMPSKNLLNSESLIDEEDHDNEAIGSNEKDITQIEEEDHEDSFSKQLTEQLRNSLMNNQQFQVTQSPSYKISDHEFPQANDISSISSYSQRQTFPTKYSSLSKTIQFEKGSSNSRPSSQRNIESYQNLNRSEMSKKQSRQHSPQNQDLITQKQEVFNFQKSDDLAKLQQDAWAIKEEQLKTELKRQETYKMDDEMRKLERKKMMKQFTQGLIGGNSFYKSQGNTPMNNFQNTQGLGSITTSTRSPCSSDHKTKPMRTNSTHFTQNSQSVRSSYVNNGVMPNSINIPTSIFENFKVKNISNYNDEE